MKFKVFIDGAEGTTGLKIHEYFCCREDIQVLTIEGERRKDLQARLEKMQQADVSFLCLPDAAAREIAAAAPADCRLIDTSTAHRTDPDWVYGLPELTAGQRERIRGSNRVANPGCHATGVIVLLRPLIEMGILNPDTFVTATSLTGYSGGGKKMIAVYEDKARGDLRADAGASARIDPRNSPAQYGLTQQHKHIPEILKMTGLQTQPAFLPVVADYYSGMEVMIPLQAAALNAAAAREVPDRNEHGMRRGLQKIYEEYYADEPFLKITEEDTSGGFIYSNRLAGSNRLEISVRGNDETILLTATFDNLGKGASGAAIQNMNIMLGLEETKGLI